MMKTSVIKCGYFEPNTFIGQLTVYTGEKQPRKLYTMSSPIRRTTRQDALADAEQLKQQHQI